MIKGTDLAYCNINVNYTAMKAAGIRFAIIKLGQGLLAKDPMFETHRIGCETVQVPWDLYWFCDYRHSGATNAQQLISKAGGNYGYRHVCQDLEFYSGFGQNPTGARMLTFCLDFFYTLEISAAIVGALYTNRDVLNQMWAAATDANKVELARHELWFASDNQNPAPTHLPILLNQWDLDVVQSWSQGAVDLDEFKGTEEEFQAWLAASPVPLTVNERLDRIEDWIVGHGGW